MLAMAHLSFALTGVVTVLLGPALPALRARFALTDAAAGLLFTAQFLGSLAGVGLSSTLLPRWGHGHTLLAGLALVTLGLAVLPLASFVIGLAAVTLYGFGLGLTGPANNLWVAETQAHRRASALTVLNTVWAAGALAGPLVLAWVLPRTGLTRALAGLAMLLAAATLALGLLLRVERSSSPVAAITVPALPTRFWFTPRAWAFGALFFLYVGVENAAGGWAAMSLERAGGLDGHDPALGAAYFWGALLVGRAGTARLLRSVREDALLRATLVLALAGGLTWLGATDARGVAFGLVLVGLGLAPIFPLAVALLSRHFGPAAARAAGVLFGLGSLGAALLPWLVGALSARAGSLTYGLAVPVAGCLGMLGAAAVLGHGAQLPQRRAG
jgi:fucose permease